MSLWLSNGGGLLQNRGAQAGLRLQMAPTPAYDSQSHPQYALELEVLKDGEDLKRVGTLRSSLPVAGAARGGGPGAGAASPEPGPRSASHACECRHLRPPWPGQLLLIRGCGRGQRTTSPAKSAKPCAFPVKQRSRVGVRGCWPKAVAHLGQITGPGAQGGASGPVCCKVSGLLLLEGARTSQPGSCGSWGSRSFWLC